jgi:hypothetical protein
VKAGETILVCPVEQGHLAPGQGVREDDQRWLVVGSRTTFDGATGGYVEKVQMVRRVVPASAELPEGEDPLY